jgi:hypothetical protein
MTTEQYVAARQNGSLEELEARARASDPEAGAAAMRKVSASFISNAWMDHIVDAKTARQAMRGVTADSKREYDADAMLELATRDRIPPPPPQTESWACEDEPITADDEREFRARQASIPNLVSFGDRRDKGGFDAAIREEDGYLTDGRGVMSSADADALDAAEAGGGSHGA